ncbi:hypothetical protein RIVM261_057480 [Rivularia sp. IAM M-261]|nr:hypothetical protein CAL7716_032520 [Calothrix sp. PCC 7716]GJD20792.1 hypothetical protein RIVM261_057480 [Rivularia sp. IAM M-261]
MFKFKEKRDFLDINHVFLYSTGFVVCYAYFGFNKKTAKDAKDAKEESKED